MKTTGRDKDQAALRYYERLYRKKQYDGAQLTAEDLRGLLETGREELLVQGHSSMLDCAFERLARAARRRPERIVSESTGLLFKFGPAGRNPVPLADCWYYMVCLQKYMTEELTAEELEAWAEIACTGRTIRPKEVITAGGLRNVIRGISEAVEECREKLLSGGSTLRGARQKIRLKGVSTSTAPRVSMARARAVRASSIQPKPRPLMKNSPGHSMTFAMPRPSARTQRPPRPLTRKSPGHSRSRAQTRPRAASSRRKGR